MPSPARIASSVAVGLGLAVFATVVSVAGFARARNPDLAVSIAPFDADAKAERAYALLERGGAKAAQAAHDQASAALVRSPLSVAAARTLGYSAALLGRAVDAKRAMTYAETLSRRDLPTQLWLIEDRVRADDVPGTLRHYDRALRTSALARPAIFPVLSSAIDDPQFTAPVARILTRRPPWREDFLRQLVDEAKHLDGAARLIIALRDPTMAERLVLQTSALKRYDLAMATLATMAPSQATAIGTMRAVPRFAPFDWQAAESPYGRAVVADGLIDFDGRSGADFDLVQRLVALWAKPQRIRVDWRAESPTPLRLTVSCADGGNVIAQGSATRSPLQLPIPVMGNCKVQRLTLSVAGAGGDRVAGTVTRIALETLG